MASDSDFGIDNEGTGFDIPSDDDFIKMIDEASGASKDENDDTPLGDSDQVTQEQKPRSRGVRIEEEPPVEQSTEVHAPPKPSVPPPAPVEEVVEDTAETQSIPVVDSDEEPADLPVDEEPVVEQNPVTEPTSGIRIPKRSDRIAEVQRIIAITDVYRELPNHNRLVVDQFLTRGKKVESEAEAVVCVLNADKLLVDSIHALHEAKKLDSVARAFFLLKLPNNVFVSLKQLLEIFSAEVKTSPNNKLEYAEELVSAIEGLEDDVIGHINATESVLVAK